MSEAYIIAEIVLLAIMVVEDVSKLAFCTRLTGKKVSHFKYFIILYLGLR
jgi:hypothetical protein